jgi:deoxyribodipyrimidine photo-lyase
MSTGRGESGVELIEVDAHNIAPCWHVSNKCEFSAKTIRGKIHNAMDTFLTDFPPLVPHPHPFSASPVDSASVWEEVASKVDAMDASVEEVDRFPSGEAAAIDAMRQFLPRLKTYADSRNDPCVSKGVSGLSPYFHFGQLSVQRVLLEIKKMYKVGLAAMFPSGERTTGIHSFCEEAVVRRELSDNFCYYNEHYDSFEGAHK